MRTSVHDQMINFRVNGDLLRAADEKARRDGMSLSELLRAAIRREVRG